MTGRAKAAFNRRWPYLRRCTTRWCWRGQTYAGHCYLHNRQSRSYYELFTDDC